MATQEIQIELLLGKKVYALNGRSLGRLEEVCVDLENGVASVNEFEVGTYALFDRLAAWEIGRAVLGLFGSLIKSGYSVKWDQIDLSEPEHLRVTCPVSELSPLEIN